MLELLRALLGWRRKPPTPTVRRQTGENSSLWLPLAMYRPMCFVLAGYPGWVLLAYRYLLDQWRVELHEVAGNRN